MACPGGNVEIEPLTEGERRWIARALAQEIRRRTRGRLDEAAIQRAIEESGRIVAELHIGQAAGLLEDEADFELVGIEPTGRRSRVRRLRHEFLHILMRDHVAPAIYGTEVVTCHRQDNRMVRHQIARIGELIDTGGVG